MDIGVYVDDLWLIDDAGELADADLLKLQQRFPLKIIENPNLFLNININVESSTKVNMSSQSYIESTADKYIPGWKTQKAPKLPCDSTLIKAYDVAHDQDKSKVPAHLVKEYRSLVGALVYTSPCVRADTCFTISKLSRALTFPTPELLSMAKATLLYLAHTSDRALHFDGEAANAHVLQAYSDSDWAVCGPLHHWVCSHVWGSYFYPSQQTTNFHISLIHRSGNHGCISLRP